MMLRLKVPAVVTLVLAGISAMAMGVAVPGDEQLRRHVEEFSRKDHEPCP